jgi:hypothetical protein
MLRRWNLSACDLRDVMRWLRAVGIGIVRDMVSRFLFAPFIFAGTAGSR